MIELLSMFNGSNNGRIFLGVRDATERLGFSSAHPALEAFRELEAVGLISNTVGGSFRIKAGVGCLARAWRLNWIADDGRRAGPEALGEIDLKAIDKKARKRLARRQAALKRFTRDVAENNFAVVDSTTRPASLNGNTGHPVVKSTTQLDRNGENPPIQFVVESTAHILHQGDAGAR